MTKTTQHTPDNLENTMGRAMLGMETQRRRDNLFARRFPQVCVYKTRSGDFATTKKGLLSAHRWSNGTEDKAYWVRVQEPRQLQWPHEEELKKLERQQKALFRKRQRLLARAWAVAAEVPLAWGIELTQKREGR